ncbi:MAG: family 16 glycoside hydrolase [Opitutales bacterium]
MKLRAFIGAVVGLLMVGVTTAEQQSLFNGKDLTGWEGEPGWWYVEDGAITAESTPDKVCHRATYLIWQGGEPSDFELTLDFKLSPKINKSNSGVQIRSERRPNWDVFGYQADMTATGHLSGFVYHHARGLIAARGERVHIDAAGTRTAEPLPQIDAIHAAFEVGEWNQYRILCDGPMIRLFLNDVTVCEFTDEDSQQARREGILALQMHPGPPMKVQFKNIQLRLLSNESVNDPSLEALIEAERLMEEGRLQEAEDLYWTLLDAETSEQSVREAALRGAVLTGGARSRDLWLETMQADDFEAARFAVRIALEMNRAQTAADLADLLVAVDARRKVLFIGILAELGRVEVLPKLEAYARSGESVVRLAAIHALGRLAGAGTAELYVELLQDAEAPIAQAAAEVLAGLAAEDVDRVVVDGLNGADAALTVQLVEVIAQRRLKAALPTLQAKMDSPDAMVRLAAIKSYGELAAVEQLPVLLELIQTRTDRADVQALGKAIAQVCILANAPEVCLPLLKTAEAAAVPEAKPMLGKVIRRIGG